MYLHIDEIFDEILKPLGIIAIKSVHYVRPNNGSIHYLVNHVIHRL